MAVFIFSANGPAAPVNLSNADFKRCFYNDYVNPLDKVVEYFVLFVSIYKPP
jgi:hypothetical protein